MNPAATMDEAKLALSGERLDGVLAFLASRSKDSTRALSATAGEVFKGMSDEVKRLLLTVIETKTAAEYDRVYEVVFPKYFALTLAMSQFARAVVPQDVVQRLTRESICELEADFRNKGTDAFGSAVRDQAMFTAWTLRKVADLTTQLAAAELKYADKQQDAECCWKFNYHAIRGQFGLDSLNMALDNSIAIYPEVLEKLTDCLRSMVNAYTWVRRGVALRIPNVEAACQIPALDEEDQEWMDASLGDMGPLLENEGA